MPIDGISTPFDRARTEMQPAFIGSADVEQVYNHAQQRLRLVDDLLLHRQEHLLVVGDRFSSGAQPGPRRGTEGAT